MTGPLSSFYGRPLVGSALTGYAPSPDDMLAEQAVPGPQLPAAPPARLSTRNEPGTVEAPPGAAAPHGDAAAAVDSALGFVGSLYEWGGTGADGRVDCSGLLYAAFNAAGIPMPRYRAKDYGRLGAPVSAEQARPGDVVYFDEPGDTDHVGLYLGNGQFVEAPQPGQQVTVSPLREGAQVRRVLPDSAFGSLPADPDGRLTFHAGNTVYTAGQAPAGHPGAQRDPVAQLQALDAAQSLQAVGQSPEVANILSSFETATPDSLFGQAAASHRFHTGEATPTAGGTEFDRFFRAVGGQESGGDYSAVSPAGARGKYQVMPENIPSWTAQALGHSMTPDQFLRDPQAQEAVARWKLYQYYRQHGLRGAAAAWYSGSPDRANDYSPLPNRSGPSVGRYVDDVLGRM